jgi:hypothetical protein
MDTPNQNKPIDTAPPPAATSAAQPVTPPTPSAGTQPEVAQQPTTQVATPANASPTTPVTPPQMTHTHKKPILLIVGICLIVIALAGGAYYFLGTMNQTKRLGVMDEKTSTVTATPDEEQMVDKISTDDIESDLNSLQKDLNQL